MSADAGPTRCRAPDRRMRRFEPAALAGVIWRNLVIFGRYWKVTTFSSVMQPIVYLFAFGVGFGSLVSHVGHVAYIKYVGTGMVASAVLFASAFPGMFNTFIRWRYQKIYDAMLAAPVDTEELVTAEILWTSLCAGTYGTAPLLLVLPFGLNPTAGMLLVPAIGFLTGFGFAALGTAIATVTTTLDNFNYITSALLTPLFLLAGTFFPVSALPSGVRLAAQFNPLFHCVQLVRDASLGNLGAADLGHTAVLLIFAALMWRLAVSQLGKRLID